MHDRKKMILTIAAQSRLQALLKSIELDIEAELRARNYVPGEDTVEITASSVEDLAQNLLLTFAARERSRLVRLKFILRLYLAVGLVLLTAGIFYPYLMDLVNDPIQLALVLIGSLMTIASLILTWWTKNLFSRRSLSLLNNDMTIDLVSRVAKELASREIEDLKTGLRNTSSVHSDN